MTANHSRRPSKYASEGDGEPFTISGGAGIGATALPLTRQRYTAPGTSAFDLLRKRNLSERIEKRDQ